MKRHVTAVTGLSGVGKSTLLRKLASTVPFQHLQAGALIRNARQSERHPLTLDQLRSVDLDENQQLLIRGFAWGANQGAGLIVLDGHTVIEQDDSLVPIEPAVFRAMGINSMIFLAEDSAEIAKRRLDDKARQRPVKNVEQLRSTQDQALLHARKICRVLGIPISVFGPNEVGAVAALLGSYLAASSIA
jgi:adenylate kinase